MGRDDCAEVIDMMGVGCSGGLRSAALAWARAPSGAGSRAI